MLMALTDFGKAVRKGRIDVNSTLRSMAKDLETSPSFLSGLETGAKKISPEWVAKIKSYFESHNHTIENLKELADVSNESVHLHDGLSHQQKLLVAGFANSPFTPDELKAFAGLLKTIRSRVEGQE